MSRGCSRGVEVLNWFQSHFEQVEKSSQCFWCLDILYASVVCSVWWLDHQLDYPGFEFQQGKRVISSSKCPHQLSGAHSASCSVHTGRSFLGVKCQMCDAVSSCLCHAKVKSEWTYTSAPLVCLRGMYRDNFTFSLSIIHLLFQGREVVHTVKCFFFCAWKEL